MSNVQIKAEGGLVQVWVDGVEQKDLLDIQIDIGRPGDLQKLKLTHLADQVDIQGELDVSHWWQCPHCGETKIK